MIFVVVFVATIMSVPTETRSLFGPNAYSTCLPEDEDRTVRPGVYFFLAPKSCNCKAQDWCLLSSAQCTAAAFNCNRSSIASLFAHACEFADGQSRSAGFRARHDCANQQISSRLLGRTSCLWSSHCNSIEIGVQLSVSLLEYQVLFANYLSELQLWPDQSRSRRNAVIAVAHWMPWPADSRHPAAGPCNGRSDIDRAPKGEFCALAAPFAARQFELISVCRIVLAAPRK